MLPEAALAVAQADITVQAGEASARAAALPRAMDDGMFCVLQDEQKQAVQAAQRAICEYLRAQDTLARARELLCELQGAQELASPAGKRASDEYLRAHGTLARTCESMELKRDEMARLEGLMAEQTRLRDAANATSHPSPHATATGRVPHAQAPPPLEGAPQQKRERETAAAPQPVAPQPTLPMAVVDPGPPSECARKLRLGHTCAPVTGETAPVQQHEAAAVHAPASRLCVEQAPGCEAPSTACPLHRSAVPRRRQ